VKPSAANSRRALRGTSARASRRVRTIEVAGVCRRHRRKDERIHAPRSRGVHASVRSAHACRRLDGRHTRRGVAAALGVVASAMPPGFADPARASDMRAPRSRGGTRRWRSAAATLGIALQPPVTSPAWQLASELGGDGRDSAAGRHTIREEKSPPRRPPRAPRSGEKRVEEDCHRGFSAAAARRPPPG